MPAAGQKSRNDRKKARQHLQKTDKPASASGTPRSNKGSNTRAFPDPPASVDRDGAGDGVGDDFEIAPAPQRDADRGFEQESIHSSSASSSSETPDGNKVKEEIRRQKAADRAIQKKRTPNAPTPTDRHSASFKA